MRATTSHETSELLHPGPRRCDPTARRDSSAVRSGDAFAIPGFAVTGGASSTTALARKYPQPPQRMHSYVSTSHAEPARPNGPPPEPPHAGHSSLSVGVIGNNRTPCAGGGHVCRKSEARPACYPASSTTIAAPARIAIAPTSVTSTATAVALRFAFSTRAPSIR